MCLDYLKEPQKLIQPTLFSQEEIYVCFDSPLFFDTLIHWQFNENIWFLTSKDLSYLMVSGFGVFLSKHSERLLIKDQKKVVYEIPFFRLKNIAILSKGVGLSSDLIEQLSKNNINLSFHDFSGKPYAVVQSVFSNQNLEIKRKQILAQNSQKSIDIIKKIVNGKISNQIALLKYMTKNIETDSETNITKLQFVQNSCSKMFQYANKVLSVVYDGESSDAIRNAIMGYEGVSARLYWGAISVLLSEKIEFAGRNDKIPQDAVNTLLNYGYGILYSQIWNSIVLAGLDPYIGYLHTIQSSKPSLVFDLIEEFRAPVIDKTVVAFVMLRRKIEIVQGNLTLETRQAFSQKVLERLTASEYYEGQKVMIRDIILAQAKRFAKCIENEMEQYKSFTFKW